jgi:hypothetical protein
MSHTIDPQKEKQLIADLAAGMTIQEAADAAGVSKRTVNRRLANPRFKRCIMDVRASCVANATARLLTGLKQATNVLNLLVESSDQRIQERAAIKLIELAVKLNAVSEQERRLEQIERFIGLHATREGA